ARDERGNPDIFRRPRRDSPDIARERKLGDIEFGVAEGAKENLLGIEGKIGRGAAFHLDATVLERAGAVIVAAGNRYGNVNHSNSFTRSSLPGLTRQSIFFFQEDGPAGQARG